MARSIVASARLQPAGGRCSHPRTRVQRLAQFVCGARWEDVSEPAGEQLKLRVLDSLGVAVGALDGEPVAMVREHRGVARGLLRHPPCAVVVTPHDPVTTYPEH